MSSQKNTIKKRNISITESSKAEDSKFNNTSASQEEAKKTYTFHVILIGNVAVGKTSILSRFVQNTYSSPYTCTVNVDYKVKAIQIGKGAQVELKIWDTCGEEKFRGVTKQYYNRADGVLAIFDLTDLVSFKHIDLWLDDIEKTSKRKPAIILVGNKADLDHERAVNEYDIKEYMQSKEGLQFEQVSAKSGMNIQLLFETMANTLVNKKSANQTEEDDKTIQSLKKEVKSSGGCC